MANFKNDQTFSGNVTLSGTTNTVSNALSLNGATTLGGSASFNGGAKILSNIADPIAAQDAATKNYVDTHNTSGFTTATGSTSSSSATTIATIAVASGTVTTIKAYIAGKNTATNDDWTGGEVVATISNASGTAALVNTTLPIIMPTSTGTFDVTVSGANALIQVTAPSSAAYSWKVTYLTVNV